MHVCIWFNLLRTALLCLSSMWWFKRVCSCLCVYSFVMHPKWYCGRYWPNVIMVPRLGQWAPLSLSCYCQSRVARLTKHASVGLKAHSAHIIPCDLVPFSSIRLCFFHLGYDPTAVLELNIMTAKYIEDSPAHGGMHGRAAASTAYVAIAILTSHK